MPKLTPRVSRRPRSVAGRFTNEEEELIREAAESRGVTPSAFAREAMLSALQTTPAERILVAMMCEVQTMVKLCFAGLLEQLNEEDRPFTREKFRSLVESAERTRSKKADEAISSIRGEFNA